MSRYHSSDLSEAARKSFLTITGRLLYPRGQGPRSTAKERNEDDEGESEPLQDIICAARGACGVSCGHGGGGDCLWIESGSESGSMRSKKPVRFPKPMEVER